MEATTSQDQVREKLVLSVWPNCKHLLTIDPTCLAAALWLRAQQYPCSIVSANRQLSMIFGTYPTLHDVPNKKHYVGFDSIYQYSRTSDPTADELALLATLKRLFVPAFMHSQWLDETNKASIRTLYHYTIGLPSSLFYIRKRFSSAQTWFNVIASRCSFSHDEQDRIYTDAAKCLAILDNELARHAHAYFGGERFSLVDAWVSAYLLVLVRHGAEKSRLRVLLSQHARLADYVSRIDAEQLAILAKENVTQPLSSSVSENSVDTVSVLYVISQVVSFSIFFFMLTKIGANSYKLAS